MLLAGIEQGQWTVKRPRFAAALCSTILRASGARDSGAMDEREMGHPGVPKTLKGECIRNDRDR
jgi:hypothetical protein